MRATATATFEGDSDSEGFAFLDASRQRTAPSVAYLIMAFDMALERPLRVGDSFSFRGHLGRNGHSSSFVAVLPEDGEHSGPYLSAVAPRDGAARFTVVSAEPAQGSAEKFVAELKRAVKRTKKLKAEHKRARLRNARVVVLRVSSPLYETEVVALPLSDPQLRLRQLCLLRTTAGKDGHFGWLTASDDGRGELLVTPACNTKAPDGWEAFDVCNFKAGDEAEHTPPEKRRKTE